MKLPRAFPPGPSTWAAMRGFRGLGAGGDLAGIARFVADVARTYGPVAHWRLARGHFFLVDDPALIEAVLVTHARDYVKGRGIARLKNLLGDGLLTSEQPLHLRRRRMLQPAFHKDRIARYGARMVAAAEAQAASWPDGAPLAMDAEMTRLTLTIAADALFSTDIGARAATVRDALGEALASFPASMSAFGELLDHLPFAPVTRRLRAARAKLDAVIYGVIDERRASGQQHDDLLDMLLAAREDERGLNDAHVRDEAMTIFLAGHETTANALAWTWLLLAQHPAVEQALHAEIDAVCGTRAPRAEDLGALRYTHAVFAEALRLYPPAWILGRRAVRPTTLGRWTVPARAIVLTSQLVTHRNPRLWPEPEAFQPGRWDAEAAHVPRFAYFPFGGGNRRCIGESFAWMEGVLVLAAVARTWRFRLAGPVPGIRPVVTLRPAAPIRVRAERRRSPVSA